MGADVVDVPNGLLDTASLAETVSRIREGASYDAIVAVGGGTVLDTAKILTVLWERGCTIEQTPEACALMSAGTPIIAVPTTAGTGSDATHFAVLYIDHVKFSVASPLLRPLYVVLHTPLVMALPRPVAIATGFDATAQAVEAMWSVKATDESMAFSREALGLIRGNFRDSVLSPTIANRAAMQRAAFRSGCAINRAFTTAAHAVSYPLSSFHGIPHGLAVFLTLPEIFAFNCGAVGDDCADPRGTGHVEAVLDELGVLLGGESRGDGPAALRSYFEAFGVDGHLSAYGVSSGPDIGRILDNGFDPLRMKNNPRVVTRSALKDILEKSL
jgi:alcohol dehydrogenase class IV